MRRTFIALLALVCFTATAFAHGPSRLKVEESVVVKAPAAKVWGMLADFCAIEKWHPGIAKCVGQGGNDVGATRVLTLKAPGDPQVTEELLKYDAEGMTYKYKLTQYPLEILPVTTYSSFLSVKDNGDGTSTVQWRAGFYRGHPNNNPPPELNDEAAVKAVTGSYQAGLAHIKELAEK